MTNPKQLFIGVLAIILLLNNFKRLAHHPFTCVIEGRREGRKRRGYGKKAPNSDEMSVR
jgi:hypothetical protein